MSTVWVGQSRGHALLITIDKYVKNCITEHDVHDESWYKQWYILMNEFIPLFVPGFVVYCITEHDVHDESWYKQWYKLIHKDVILEKERHFQLIAFQITGDPDSTVHDCIQSLFHLIPKLTDHIEIIDTNEKGNIQYIVHNKPSVKQNFDNNPYQSLQESHDDDDTSTNELPQEPPTDVPPTIRNISPITSTDNTPTHIFKSAYI